jgi:LysM repeat protein
VAYCVQPVGDISTYSGYSAAPTLPITVPPATFSSVNTAIPSAVSNPNPSYTSSQMPTASGTIPNCVSYVNYNSNTTIEDWNSCSFAVYAYDVAFTDLIAWNPSLSSDQSSCEFQAGLSYCVRQTNASSYVSPDNGCLQVNKTEIMDGTSPACVCYTEVDGSDGGYGMGCDDVASDSSITVAQLQSFNSWLGSGSLDDCTSAMFADLDENDTRAVCIGVNSTAPTSTATKPPSTVSTPTKTVSSASQGPTQSGVVAGCQDFYTVQSGDSCASIEGLYAITFAQLYSWNPSSKSDPRIRSWSMLTYDRSWLELREPLARVSITHLPTPRPSSLTLSFRRYAYCVKGPASTTSSGGATAPTQSGEAANCNHYYTVQSGDSCSAIETQFGITFQQLYQWNPAIGSNCESLWVGYAVCVGVSS